MADAQLQIAAFTNSCVSVYKTRTIHRHMPTRMPRRKILAEYMQAFNTAIVKDTTRKQHIPYTCTLLLMCAVKRHVHKTNGEPTFWRDTRPMCQCVNTPSQSNPKPLSYRQKAHIHVYKHVDTNTHTHTCQCTYQIKLTNEKA